jgi:hypothetical protein
LGDRRELAEDLADLHRADRLLAGEQADLAGLPADLKKSSATAGS